jgi:hypothetical protein
MGGGITKIFKFGKLPFYGTPVVAALVKEPRINCALNDHPYNKGTKECLERYLLI